MTAWRFAAALALLAVALAFLAPAPTFAQSAPGTPSTVSVSRADGSLTASGYSVNGATHYHITYSSNGGSSWSLAALSHTSSSITIGADNSKTYLVGVRAGNDHGYSGWRNSASAAPFQPAPAPGPVASVNVTRSDGALEADWPSVTGATRYHVTYSSTGGQSWQLAALGHSSSSITIQADNAKNYIVGVRAGNSGGWSGWRNSAAAGPYVPPVTAPNRPTGLAATAGNGSATLAWDDPSNPTITGYEYSVRWAGVAWSAWTAVPSGTSHTVTGLENGKEYRFKVRAVNAGGVSKPAPAAAPWYVAVTPKPLDAPANVAVNPSEDSLDITWDPVAGATGYDVRAKAEGASEWHDVAGNVSGTSYTYATTSTMDYVGVRARDGDFASAWTDLSNLPPDDLMNVATSPSSGGAFAQSGVSAQSGGSIASQLAAPTWGTVTRDIRRGARQGDGTISINWTGVSGATGYSIACSHHGWYWHKCGWDDDGTLTFTPIPSSESQPVKLTHYKREVYNPGNYRFGNSRSYMVSMRAVNANPADASAWVNTLTLRPVFPYLNDFTVTRTDGQLTLSWTPGFWTTGYEIDCAAVVSGQAAAYTRCATLADQDDTDDTHSITITNWTADGTNYSIDNTSIYDLQIFSTNTWSRARWLPPLIHPVSLAVSNVGATTTTLTIAKHSNAWYYKANAAPDNTCQGPVTAGTSSKDLTGLSAGTTYTYTAYSDSACTTANRLATASAFTTSVTASNLAEADYGSGNPIAATYAQEFTTGSSAGGYTLRSVTLDFVTGATPSVTVSIREKQSNGKPTLTDRATFTGSVTATGETTFTCSSGCDLDASTPYFVYFTSTAADISFIRTTQSMNETLQPSGNGWAIADEMQHYTSNAWTKYSTYVLQVGVEAVPDPALVASNVTATGATLTLDHYLGGDWYYEANVGPHATCQGPVSGSTVTLSGLTAGTAYIYTAYSNSVCSSVNEIAEAAFSPISLAASNVAATTATLTIAGHSDDWYYKANAAPHTACQSAVSTSSTDLTGLSAGTTYTYEAYSDSACTTANKLATASAFTTLVDLAASNIGATTATLTISGHSGQWWYKGNAGPDITCQGPVSAGDSTEDLTGLSPQSSYDYTAYSATGCGSGDLLATAPGFTTVATVSNLANAKGSADKEVDSARDRAIQFTTGSHAEGFDLRSVTLTLKQKTAGGTLRVALHADSSGVPASTALATLTGTAPTSSSWTDATFTCSAAACDNLGNAANYHIVLENTANSGAWSWAWSASGSETMTPNTNGWNIGDGYVNRGTFWSAETSTHYLARIGFHFRPSLRTGSITATGAQLTLDYHHENWWYKADTGPHATCQGPATTPAVTLTGLTSGTPYTYSAYDASGCASANLLDAAPAFTPEASSLTASNIGATTATLTIGGYDGQWWYDADTGPHTACQGPVAASTSTEDITGLSADTTYTYEAYSASGCADTDKLATATAFTTPPGLPRNVSVANSTFDGNTRRYVVSWNKPANTQATDTFAYQVRCTTESDKTTTSWAACGNQNVSSTANTDLSLTVSHSWSSANFTYVRVRTDKDGRYSDWVIRHTQYGTP